MNRLKFVECSCTFISRILTSGGLCRVGWKCCRFDSIGSNRYESFPLLSIHRAGSWFVRDATPCKSSWDIKCLIRLDWSLLPCFKKEEGSCIITSWILTSSSADRRRANWDESYSASDESTQFRCIGHGCPGAPLLGLAKSLYYLSALKQDRKSLRVIHM